MHSCVRGERLGPGLLNPSPYPSGVQEQPPHLEPDYTFSPSIKCEESVAQVSVLILSRSSRSLQV